MSTGRDFVVIVEDSSVADVAFEYATTATTKDEARLNAQEVFPSGIIRSVHFPDELADIDALMSSAFHRRRVSRTQALDSLKHAGIADEAMRTGLKPLP